MSNREGVRRIGAVVYWFFTTIAVFAILGGAINSFERGTWELIGLGVVCAIPLYGIGFAARYILSGFADP